MANSVSSTCRRLPLGNWQYDPPVSVTVKFHQYETPTILLSPYQINKASIFFLWPFLLCFHKHFFILQSLGEDLSLALLHLDQWGKNWAKCPLSCLAIIVCSCGNFSQKQNIPQQTMITGVFILSS